MTTATPGNTNRNSIKDRTSIKWNLCLTNVHLKYGYFNYIDSESITFSKKQKKPSTVSTVVDISFLSYQ